MNSFWIPVFFIGLSTAGLIWEGAARAMCALFLFLIIIGPLFEDGDEVPPSKGPHE